MNIYLWNEFREFEWWPLIRGMTVIGQFNIHFKYCKINETHFPKGQDQANELNLAYESTASVSHSFDSQQHTRFQSLADMCLALLRFWKSFTDLFSFGRPHVWQLLHVISNRKVFRPEYLDILLLHNSTLIHLCCLLTVQIWRYVTCWKKQPQPGIWNYCKVK